MKNKLFIFLLCFTLLNVTMGFGAVVTRYVNPGSTGGDGTTAALSGANAAYASLFAWEAAEETDLVTDGDSHIVYCAGSTVDTTTTTIHGWTLGSNNRLTIQGDNTTGKWDTNCYRLIGASGIVLKIGEYYVTLNNLQIQCTRTTTQLDNALGFYWGSISDSDTRINDCILRDGRYTVRDEGLQMIKFVNCVIYGGEEGGVGLITSGENTITMYNCTVSDCGYGIREYVGVIVATNCAVCNNTDDFKDFGGNTIDFCASDDGDGTNSVNISPGGTEADDWNDAFTDYVNGDFSVKTTTSVIYNAGTDLSGSGVSDDIIGTARPQATTYDIGAFEYISAGGGGTVIDRPHVFILSSTRSGESQSGNEVYSSEGNRVITSEGNEVVTE